MSEEWQVARVTGRCAATGRELAEGETYYACLFEGPQGLDRRDYSVEAWNGPPEGCFCFWKGRIPTKEKKPATIAVDTELLTHLFLRLEDQDSEAQQQFRFVLGLLLMRKRVLRLEGTTRRDGAEYWQMKLGSDGSMHELLNPRLTNEQIDRLGQQLLAILSGEVDAVNAVESPPAEPTAESNAEGETDTTATSDESPPSHAESEEQVASP